MTQAALRLASAGYARARTDGFVTRSPVSAEYDVISRVTRQLAEAARTSKSDFPRLARALHDNRRLWTLLAADVLDADNPLPPDLRARIVWLSEFVQTHSAQVLSGKARLRPLVDVNMAVLRGLKHQETLT